MVILESLTLKNFLSHSDTKIEFQLNQAILISGSSGSGKSSLIEAILFAFFGKGRISNRFLIKHGENSAKVIITLKKNDREYQIKRSVAKDGKNNLEVSEFIKDSFTPIKVTGTRELQLFIEKEILHSSYTLFVNSVISPQNNSDSFVSQTATRRKEIILEIAEVEKYDNYYKKTKEKLEKNKIQEIEKRIKIENLQEFIEENKNSVTKLSFLENENNKLESKLKKIEKELLEIKEKQSEAKLANAKISEKNDQLEEITDSMSIIETELANFQKPKVPIITELERIKELKNNERLANEWNIKMLKIEKQKPSPVLFNNKELKNKITLLENEKTENCPELNKPCPIIIKERNKKIKELKGTLEDNNVEENRYFEKTLVYDKKIKDLGECPKVNTKELEQLELKAKEYEEMKEQIIVNTHKKEELKILRIKEKKIKKEIEKLGIPADEDILFSDEIFCKQKLDETKYAYNENTKLLSVIKNTNKMIKSNKETIKKIKKEKKELDTKIESLELLKDAFGNNGLKAIVVDQLIPRLEDKINEMLSKLSDFSVKLETQRKGVSEDTILEGLFIVIQNEMGRELDFEAFSGGEQCKISNAISGGLATFSKSGFRVLDESMTGFDEETINSFADVMLKLKEDTNQLICISHLQSVKDLFEEKIELVKINGNSKIQI